MKLTAVLALCSVLALQTARGELVDELVRLQFADYFSALAIEDKLYLTQMVASAEACKLHTLIRRVGHDKLVEVISHLPPAEAVTMQTYLARGQIAEANDTCVVDP